MMKIDREAEGETLVKLEIQRL